MRTIEVAVYQLDELSPASRKAAIKHMADLNVSVSHDWQEPTWEWLRETIGLDANTRARDYRKIAKTVLGQDWLRDCPIYRAAATYLAQSSEDDSVTWTFARAVNAYIEKTFDDEYSYLTSDEQIAEAIRANEYEFLADGQPLPYVLTNTTEER